MEKQPGKLYNFEKEKIKRRPKAEKPRKNKVDSDNEKNYLADMKEGLSLIQAEFIWLKYKYKPGSYEKEMGELEDAIKNFLLEIEKRKEEVNKTGFKLNLASLMKNNGDAEMSSLEKELVELNRLQESAEEIKGEIRDLKECKTDD